MRLGAIDCGSNAIRMVIAEMPRQGEIVRLMVEREPVRLGHGAFTRGELDPETMDEAVRVMGQFRRLFNEHGVERYRAVATSAVRSADNRDIFLHRLYHEAGVELDVIDGEEEARLVRKAVSKAFSGHVLPNLVLDLGGGSLEINVRGRLGWRGYSLPIGTVRLVETFGLTGVIGHEEAGMVRRYAATLLQTLPLRGNSDLMPAAACGGNAEALAVIFGKMGVDGMSGFDLDALERGLPDILGANVEERMARFNVRRDRAEVMAVAALVFATVSRALQVTRLIVPGVGVRDALLFELVEAIADEAESAEDAQGKALLTAARTYAQRVGHDISHGENVRHLARSIFDQLRDLHHLPDDLGVVLEVAALLHDIGEVVHADSHHKHSEYLIRWGRIPGLVGTYREMVAVLARTHRKGPPDLAKHRGYAELPKTLRQPVRTLSAILRLADGLDTEHRQGIADVVVSRLGNTISLDLLVDSEHVKKALDQNLLLRKAEQFERELGHRVTFTIGTPVTPGQGLPHVAPPAG